MRASTRLCRAVRVGPRPAAAAPAHGRRHRAPGRGRAVLAAVSARAAATQRTAGRKPGRAADRRAGPVGRRVRGIPARATVRFPDHHPRAGHDPSARRRRWCCLPPTAPGSCTTRCCAGACTTGSSTRPGPGGGDPAGAGPRASRRTCSARSARWWDGCARWSCTSRPASRRRSPGPRALAALGLTRLEPGPAAATLGAVLKDHQDIETVTALLPSLLPEAARSD